MHVVDCLYVCGNFGTKLFQGGENCETREKRIFFFFFENERIGNSYRDGTNKTLDFSLDLR